MNIDIDNDERNLYSYESCIVCRIQEVENDATVI